jgi:glycosyltransferase involved in cell wall biosynthesis
VQRDATPANEKAIHSYSPTYGSVLTNLGRARATFRDDARLLFASGDSSTRGHLYRVEHHVAALTAGGLQTVWCAVDEVSEAHLSGVTMVVVFRAPWDPKVAALYAACQARGITIAFDVDDLVFEPAYMREPYFDYVRTLDAVARERWAEKVAGWRRSLLEADCAIVSTAPLAAAAEALGKRACVWSNGISYRMIDEARRVSDRASRQSGADRHIRLGYASGAPTHQKDFARIAAPLAAVLTERPEVILTIVGYLDLTEFPELITHSPHIERRPLVPHHELGRDYARFDINLAPLEAGNPFCEAKSELKYFEAALVQVPTVAAATAPYAAAIQSGINGYIARSEAEWRDLLVTLIDEQDTRRRLGREAYWHALVRFGPEAQCLDGLAVIAELTAGGR